MYQFGPRHGQKATPMTAGEQELLRALKSPHPSVRVAAISTYAETVSSSGELAPLWALLNPPAAAAAAVAEVASSSSSSSSSSHGKSGGDGAGLDRVSAAAALDAIEGISHRIHPSVILSHLLALLGNRAIRADHALIVHIALVAYRLSVGSFVAPDAAPTSSSPYSTRPGPHQHPLRSVVASRPELLPVILAEISSTVRDICSVAAGGGGSGETRFRSLLVVLRAFLDYVVLERPFLPKQSSAGFVSTTSVIAVLLNAATIYPQVALSAVAEYLASVIVRLPLDYTSTASLSDDPLAAREIVLVQCATSFISLAAATVSSAPVKDSVHHIQSSMLSQIVHNVHVGRPIEQLSRLYRQLSSKLCTVGDASSHKVTSFGMLEPIAIATILQHGGANLSSDTVRTLLAIASESLDRNPKCAQLSCVPRLLILPLFTIAATYTQSDITSGAVQLIRRIAGASRVPGVQCEQSAELISELSSHIAQLDIVGALHQAAKSCIKAIAMNFDRSDLKHYRDVITSNSSDLVLPLLLQSAPRTAIHILTLVGERISSINTASTVPLCKYLLWLISTNTSSDAGEFTQRVLADILPAMCSPVNTVVTSQVLAIATALANDFRSRPALASIGIRMLDTIVRGNSRVWPSMRAVLVEWTKSKRQQRENYSNETNDANTDCDVTFVNIIRTVCAERPMESHDEYFPLLVSLIQTESMSPGRIHPVVLGIALDGINYSVSSGVIEPLTLWTAVLDSYINKALHKVAIHPSIITSLLDFCGYVGQRASTDASEAVDSVRQFQQIVIEQIILPFAPFVPGSQSALFGQLGDRRDVRLTSLSNPSWKSAIYSASLNAMSQFPSHWLFPMLPDTAADLISQLTSLSEVNLDSLGAEKLIAVLVEHEARHMRNSSLKGSSRALVSTGASAAFASLGGSSFMNSSNNNDEDGDDDEENEDDGRNDTHSESHSFSTARSSSATTTVPGKAAAEYIKSSIVDPSNTPPSQRSGLALASLSYPHISEQLSLPADDIVQQAERIYSTLLEKQLNEVDCTLHWTVQSDAPRLWTTWMLKFVAMLESIYSQSTAEKQSSADVIYKRYLGERTVHTSLVFREALSQISQTLIGRLQIVLSSRATPTSAANSLYALCGLCTAIHRVAPAILAPIVEHAFEAIYSSFPQPLDSQIVVKQLGDEIGSALIGSLARLSCLIPTDGERLLSISKLISECVQYHQQLQQSGSDHTLFFAYSSLISCGIVRRCALSQTRSGNSRSTSYSTVADSMTKLLIRTVNTSTSCTPLAAAGAVIGASLHSFSDCRLVDQPAAVIASSDSTRLGEFVAAVWSLALAPAHATRILARLQQLRQASDVVASDAKFRLVRSHVYLAEACGIVQLLGLLHQHLLQQQHNAAATANATDSDFNYKDIVELVLNVLEFHSDALDSATQMTTVARQQHIWPIIILLGMRPSFLTARSCYWMSIDCMWSSSRILDIVGNVSESNTAARVAETFELLVNRLGSIVTTSDHSMDIKFVRSSMAAFSIWQASRLSPLTFTLDNIAHTGIRRNTAAEANTSSTNSEHDTTTSTDETSGFDIASNVIEPDNLNRLPLNTSYSRAVFEGLVTNINNSKPEHSRVSSMLFTALTKVNCSLPAVHWAPIVTHPSTSPEVCLRFAAHHAPASSSLLTFTVSAVLDAVSSISTSGCDKGLVQLALSSDVLGQILEIGGLATSARHSNVRWRILPSMQTSLLPDRLTEFIGRCAKHLFSSNSNTPRKHKSVLIAAQNTFLSTLVATLDHVCSTQQERTTVRAGVTSEQAAVARHQLQVADMVRQKLLSTTVGYFTAPASSGSAVDIADRRIQAVFDMWIRTCAVKYIDKAIGMFTQPSPSNKPTTEALYWSSKCLLYSLEQEQQPSASQVAVFSKCITKLLQDALELHIQQLPNKTHSQMILHNLTAAIISVMGGPTGNEAHSQLDKLQWITRILNIAIMILQSAQQHEFSDKTTALELFKTCIVDIIDPLILNATGTTKTQASEIIDAIPSIAQLFAQEPYKGGEVEVRKAEDDIGARLLLLTLSATNSANDAHKDEDALFVMLREVRKCLPSKEHWRLA
ncbi:hypothetical protein GQ42DRAFT_59812 [Ramicandelaber brevisporus]|nr:hypothetical protein GQ42DRAFT_59812 [Ramicandelaber brevisporus]